ncbi:hypothetical protein [Mycobacterium sp. 1245805.9]|uniref:hypothetical protein n=1 Tax=Mycobacterium sp. 1245805.9 TaxID=1856862 RepID=UPI0012EACE1D|nr:hypothetical protein [Mycobacterium sp. 1245805.9]
MTNRKATRAAAVFGGAALVLAVGLGAGGPRPGAGAPLNVATSSSSGTAATGGDGGGAIDVQPVGGSPCIVGLNCGCIPRVTCPTPHPRPGTAGSNQHNPPAPQNP